MREINNCAEFSKIKIQKSSTIKIGNQPQVMQNQMEDSQNDKSSQDETSAKSSFQSQENKQGQNEKQLLDWKKYLYDENTQIEVIKFKKWDRNLEFPDQYIFRKYIGVQIKNVQSIFKVQNELKTLKNYSTLLLSTILTEVLFRDLNRTRNSEEYFKKEKTQKNLQLIATFYCISNKVNYQQGMLDIIVPFLLLRSPTFKLPKCYAYFNTFMNKYFPQILKARSSNNGKSLPHANCSITLCKILLRYHSQKLAKLLDKLDIDLSATVTSWLLTMFSQGTQLNLVYLIYDEFLKRGNSIGLILMQEEKIWQLCEEDEDMIMLFFNKQIKDLKTRDCVYRLFTMADKIKKNTPKSFEIFIDNIGFNDHSILSIEDIQNMLHLNMIEDMIPLYSSEIIENMDQKKEEDIAYTLIDCRVTTPEAPPLPNTITYSLQKLLKSDKQIDEYATKITDFIKQNDPQQVNTHFTFVLNTIQTQEEIKILQKLSQRLKKQDVSCISLLLDSKKLVAYIKSQKELGKQKVITNLQSTLNRNSNGKEQDKDKTCTLI